MHVAKDYYLVLSKLFDEVFTVIDSRMKQFGRFTPPAIQIYTQCVASVITSYDTVWVEHRNYLEDKLLSQKLSFFGLCDKVIDRALNHK
jgi:hypothetical protein